MEVHMGLKRILYVTGIVGAVLLGALFSFSPSSAAVWPDDPDPPEGDINYFCENPDVQHPVGSRLADYFAVKYDDVMGWFCDDGMGFGQIMLALSTAEVAGGDATSFLQQRAAGEGWGQIWQSLGLIGRDRPKTNGENADVEPSEDAGPPADRGRPEDPGSPEDLGRSNGVGPGEDRGRHLGHFKDKDR